MYLEQVRVSLSLTISVRFFLFSPNELSYLYTVYNNNNNIFVLLTYMLYKISRIATVRGCRLWRHFLLLFLTGRNFRKLIR